MSLEEIDAYTDQIARVCQYIYLHILGEPLLHPQFEEILKMLDRKGLKLQLVTNGTLLHKYPDLLDHTCLRKLSISLHSQTDEINDEYFKTISSLLEKDTGKVIELRFYDETSLSEELKQYKKELIKKYSISDTKKRNSYQLKHNVYLYEEDFFRWPDIHDPVISFEGTCHGGVDMLGINHNGDVCLCCLDPKAHNYLGNLKKDTLTDILQSEKYLKIVSSLKQRRITEDLCSRCTYRLRF